MLRAGASGEVLWQYRTNSGITGVPTTFEVDGVQYVAVQSGWGVDAQGMTGRIDRARGTVLLVKQFRMPVYLNPLPGAAERGMLIEVCAGLLDDNDAETAIRKEAEEELGYRLRSVRRVFDAYMSPGSVSERLSLFVAEYSPADRISAGGGAADEGEDIEVLEMPLREALALVDGGTIMDAKTVMLLQHAALKELA